MAGSIKLFQSLKSFYQTAGLVIQPTKSNRNYAFNAKNLFFLITPAVSCVSELAYFMFQSESIIESAQTFYTALEAGACIFNFMIQFLKISDILKLIERLDCFVEESKELNSSEKNAKIKKFSNGFDSKKTIRLNRFFYYPN